MEHLFDLLIAPILDGIRRYRRRRTELTGTQRSFSVWGHFRRERRRERDAARGL